jgi:hypothetical protein
MIFWLAGMIGGGVGAVLGATRRWRLAGLAVMVVIVLTVAAMAALAGLLPGPGAMIWPVIVLTGLAALAGVLAGLVLGWAGGMVWRARRGRANPDA